MNIFLSENDNQEKIFEKISSNIDISKYKDESKEIFSKAHNNYVGYFMFKVEDEFYKVFILPKNIKPPQDPQNANEEIKLFLEYLKIFYQLKSKYPKRYETNDLNISSILELAFDTKDNVKQAQNIEQFVFYKYKVIIQEITKFFNTHKSHKRVKNSYISQTLKHKINLTKNIQEINKTKIHQDKYEDILYSQIATICYGAIKLFIRQKIELIEEHRDEILEDAIKLQNILLKKYKVDKSFHLSLHKLISTKVYKVFKKQNEKNLYANIMSLFGIENFYDEKNDKDLNRNLKADSLFIRPELMYEWYVYDWIKENKEEAIKLGIDFDEIYLRDDKNKKSYYIKNNGTTISTRSSQPDIVLVKDNKKTIIDVKWKKLKEIAKKVDDKEPTPNGLNMNDVLKLQRDSDVHKADSAILVFLSLPKEINGNRYQVIYDKEETEFNFKLLEISMNLDRVLLIQIMKASQNE